MMEQTGQPGKVHVSETTYALIKKLDHFRIKKGEKVKLHDGKNLRTYFVELNTKHQTTGATLQTRR